MNITIEKDILRENIDKLKAYHKEYGNYDVPQNWRQDLVLSRWVENIRKHPAKLSPVLIKQLKNIKFEFEAQPTWDSMFSKLESFYEKYGDSYVPPFQQKYELLFDWTVNQRRSRYLLTKVQIDKLESLDFEWETLNDKDLLWENRYKSLIQFKKQYGHTKVPQDFKQDKTLGFWVAVQRSLNTQVKLLRSRRKKLDEIGFLWKEDIIRIREEAWEKRFNELVRYKEIHGNIDRLKVKHENYQLGLWVSTQIVHQDKMSVARREKLNKIGFEWSPADIHEERWNEMFAKLKAYKKRHRNCRVKKSEDFKLSVWLQRNKRDNKKISKDKRKKLERLGVQWPHELSNEIWLSRYNELKAFKKEYGHLRVPRSNRQLSEWINTQKKFKAEGTLTKERNQKLDKIGFLWVGTIGKQMMKVWESFYIRFKKLKEKNKSDYHIKLREHPKLNKWVKLQIHSQDKLSEAKRKKLNAIGFLWSGKNYKAERWEEKYRALLEYKKKYGNCDVPQNFEDKSLAHWVNGQRAKPLSKDRREKLIKIGFSWANELKIRRWMQRLNEFIALKNKNRHLIIRHHTELYSWLYQQRKNFPKLSAEKRKMLLKAGIIIK